MKFEINPVELETLSRHGISDADLLALRGHELTILNEGVETVLVARPDGGTMMVKRHYLRQID